MLFFGCIPLFLLHLAKIQTFGINRFFSNSSTKSNFTNMVADIDNICLYIVYDKLRFGGSSTKSNIVCLTMLVPQIQLSVLSTCGGYHPSELIVASLHKSKQITIIKTIIDLSNLHYFHVHNFYVSV